MKICPSCKVVSLIKHGKRNWKQRYKCKSCGVVCWGVIRWEVDFKELYDSFCFENRTYKQLWRQYNATIKTIQKWLDQAILKKKKFLSVKVSFWWIQLTDEEIMGIWFGKITKLVKISYFTEFHTKQRDIIYLE